MSADREAFLEAAAEIAREVTGQARHARDGGIYWNQAAPRDAEPQPSRPLNSFLYPGSTGVALFFALAAKVLGDREHRSLALQAVEPLRRELREIAPDPERARQVQLPIGGLAGLGSLVYGLLRLGDLLEEPALWDEAVEVSSLLTAERISGGEHLEVMTGSAGAILALLALERRRPGENRNGDTPLSLALLAAEHLLRRRDSWQALPIGFCHGAAGIAGALARAARRTERADLRAAAEEIWALVDSTYDPEVENWRLPCRAGISTSSWCNGATGILLGGLALHDPGTLPRGGSLAGALKTLRMSPLESTDHLCCGNLGRVDALVHVAAASGDKEIMEDARSLARQVLERARREGRYRLMFHPQDLVDVRLFPGSAGVGYAFLRLAEPGSLPCVLDLS